MAATVTDLSCITEFIEIVLPDSPRIYLSSDGIQDRKTGRNGSGTCW